MTTTSKQHSSKQQQKTSQFHMIKYFKKKKKNFTQKQEHPLTHHTSYLKNHKITAIPSDQKHNLQQKKQ